MSTIICTRSSIPRESRSCTTRLHSAMWGKSTAYIQYFVTDGNGTGQPGVWFSPGNPRYDAMVRESFEVISDNLPRTPLRIFGLRITNSAYGFGTIVLRRTQAKANLGWSASNENW